MLARTAAVVGQVVMRAWLLLAAALAIGAGWTAWRMLRAARRQRIRAKMVARLRYTLDELDAMDDRQFEFALRDLLIRDGFHARQVGQKGDQGADVIAQDRHYGRMVVQAKHTTVAARVGSRVMYELKGTAGPVHQAHTAVLVTNGTITRDAKAWGERHDIHWVDRTRLGQWATEGTPLHQLLRLPRRTRRNRRTASCAVGTGR
ncbi:restriction endonuclease [Streptomyces sp. NPDC101151]|uniref:restriction endonuclease n=1 Tax=Streptomyces sp. NPDC101151 TaxID=3366115 RepID=UPI00380FDDB0